jgi:hypothetical protein
MRETGYSRRNSLDEIFIHRIGWYLIPLQEALMRMHTRTLIGFPDPATSGVRPRPLTM